MKRLLCLGLGALLALAGFAQESKVGTKPGDFSLKDLKGGNVQYAQLKGTVTVVIFIATKCPVSNAYNERMSALYRDYAPKGVKFVFVNPNSTEPAAEVEEHAGKNSFPFAVYKDPNNVMADLFHAQYTPEAFILDEAGGIRYHGHLDDAQNAARITRQGLRLALDAMLAGKAVDPAETKAFGCTIKRVKKSS
jgi:peroxiredoxin